MKSWHANPKTIPPQEMQQELPLQHSSENTESVTVAQVIQQIGQLLTQVNYLELLSQPLRLDARFSLDTPVMAEALSFALWVTANHIMTTCDQLKTSINTSKHSPSIMRNNGEVYRAVNLLQDEVRKLLAEVYPNGFIR